MIAIDTNVLLRYLLQDDEKQSELARQVILGSDEALITGVVLVETIWTLKGKKYRLDKAGVLATLNALFAEPNLVFEDDQAVWRALQDYSKSGTLSKRSADFPNALIVNKAKSYSKTWQLELTGIYTFDKGALQLEGTLEPNA